MKRQSGNVITIKQKRETNDKRKSEEKSQNEKADKKTTKRRKKTWVEIKLVRERTC